MNTNEMFNKLIELKKIHSVNKPDLYFNLYANRFYKFFDKEIRFLEIGLLTGGPEHGDTNLNRIPSSAPSMGLWGEYFSKAEIWGSDINDFSHLSEKGNWNFFRVDASYKNQFLELTDHVKEKNNINNDELFDIIIDDGSHASYHQQNSFFTLWPYLKSGGVFAIEDVHWQPHWERNKHFEGDLDFYRNLPRVPKSTDVFKSILKGENKSDYFFIDELNNYRNEFADITIEKFDKNGRGDREQMIFIYKK